MKSIKKRWDQWLKFNDDRFSPLCHLVVHPTDWASMRYPREYKGLPVKPLGIDLVPRPAPADLTMAVSNLELS